MILTPHLLTGAAIAAKISNPIWALPLAFLSHYFEENKKIPIFFWGILSQIAIVTAAIFLLQ